jgi:acetyl-CoA carboxylase biotin carboxylase subunit
VKLLVANRGEIAVRVLQACREMGIPSVAVYSTADSEALHTRYADEAWPIGPAAPSESYLSIPALLDAARRCGATAVHPGYGFLSENASFARAAEDAGLTFVGPTPETISLTGDKLAARRAAREAGLQVLPGADTPVGDEITWTGTAQVHFPTLVKAVAGGGGRGIRLARNAEELPPMIAAARKEAFAAFGDGAVYLEPLVQRARHIEVQILGDGAGRVVCLGDRECSIQRRRQKLIEEAPAPGLEQGQRERVFDMAVALAQALHYRSLGTVEFLLGAEGDLHFIEVNPRIQVEHPVTEVVTGLDLVKEQLRVACGEPLRHPSDFAASRGCAIEARVLAEDPAQDFLPAVGEITYLKEPGGPGIRVDSALYQGLKVTTNYDSLLAKVIAWGEDRQSALQRLRRALREFQIGGLATDLSFLLQIAESLPFARGDFDTTYLDDFAPPPQPVGDLEREHAVALAAALLAHRQHAATSAPPAPASDHWRSAAWTEQM